MYAANKLILQARLEQPLCRVFKIAHGSLFTHLVGTTYGLAYSG